jgi:hypothetical protein
VKKASAHVRERRRSRKRFGDADTHERSLVAIERDPVATHQPIPELRLALAEQLKVKQRV